MELERGGEKDRGDGKEKSTVGGMESEKGKDFGEFMITNPHIIDAKLGDRICWANRGDTDFGTVAKINRKTFVCNESNKYNHQVIVDKVLVYEVVRFDKPLKGLME